MATQIQMVMYEGYLTADPDMRYLETGQAVTNFRIGSNNEYKTRDGEKTKQTTWLKVSAWGKLGEIVAQYAKKGSHVIVVGKLRVEPDGGPKVYEKSDGTFGAAYEIVASTVRILDSRDGSVEASAENDEIPF